MSDYYPEPHDDRFLTPAPLDSVVNGLGRLAAGGEFGITKDGNGGFDLSVGEQRGRVTAMHSSQGGTVILLFTPGSTDPDQRLQVLEANAKIAGALAKETGQALTSVPVIPERLANMPISYFRAQETVYEPDGTVHRAGRDEASVREAFDATVYRKRREVAPDTGLGK